MKALDTIKPNEINEIRALAKPPAGTSCRSNEGGGYSSNVLTAHSWRVWAGCGGAGVKVVCEAVCVMLDIKPVKIPDPEVRHIRPRSVVGVEPAQPLNA